MDQHHLHEPDTEGVRISDSPRRSPHITHCLTSPIRSIHAMQMESLHSQPDMGMRTTDFFEDSSEEAILDPDDDVAPDADLVGRRASVAKKRNTASTTDAFVTQCEPRIAEGMETDLQGYHRLSTDEVQFGRDGMVDTADSSFRGSVDELLPSGGGGGRVSSPREQLKRSRLVSEVSPRSFAPTQQQRHLSVPTTKVDHTLGAYAIAHEITLNALMRDEEALFKTLDTYALAPLSAEGRQSLLPHALDPRSPRRATFSSPATATTKKSVQVVPPPIDTSVPRRSIPDDIVRTPYPFSPESGQYRGTDRGEVEPASREHSLPLSETILTISIARSNANKKARVTTLTIPAVNDFTAVRLSSVGAKERHFKALDFDDAKFFYNLRRCYRELSGPARYLSARSLSRVVVSRPVKAADAGYNWRGSRAIAAKGSRDTFSEEQILRHFQEPTLGRSRYAFVHWAHRLADGEPAGPVEQSADRQGEDGNDRSGGEERLEGLMFVLSWSVKRILAVLLLVLVAGVAATLLWIFLGRNTAEASPPRGGFRDAGDRVGTGMLIGICVLLLGLSGIAGWLGVSWVII